MARGRRTASKKGKTQQVRDYRNTRYVNLIEKHAQELIQENLRKSIEHQKKLNEKSESNFVQPMEIDPDHNVNKKMHTGTELKKNLSLSRTQRKKLAKKSMKKILKKTNKRKT